MKYLIIFILFKVFISCSFFEAVNKDFKTETEIDSMAEPKTLAERYGDGKVVKFNVKVPLTETSIHYYDLEEVLGNRELDHDKKEFIDSLLDSLKYSIYNLFVRLGSSNNIKVTSYFKFPKINRKYIKGVYVKKAFFTTEDCRKEEQNCDNLDKMGSNFNLLDKIVVNVSGARKEEVSDTRITDLEDEEFDQHFKSGVEQENQKEKNILSENFSDGKHKNINLIHFYNQNPWLYLSFDEMERMDPKARTIKLKFDRGFEYVKTFLLRKEFKAYVKKVKTTLRPSVKHKKLKFTKDGIKIKLRKNVTPMMLFRKIESFRPKLSKNMVILRLNSKIPEGKAYLKSALFRDLVDDVTIIGRSLYVKMKPNQKYHVLNNRFQKNKESFFDKLDIYKVDKCDRSNCLDLDVSRINLANILEKSEDIRIDTLLKVRNLRKSDFKYNGYLDVELELDLPL